MTTQYTLFLIPVMACYLSGPTSDKTSRSAVEIWRCVWPQRARGALSCVGPEANRHARRALRVSIRPVAKKKTHGGPGVKGGKWGTDTRAIGGRSSRRPSPRQICRVESRSNSFTTKSTSSTMMSCFDDIAILQKKCY